MWEKNMVECPDLFLFHTIPYVSIIIARDVTAAIQTWLKSEAELVPF